MSEYLFRLIDDETEYSIEVNEDGSGFNVAFSEVIINETDPVFSLWLSGNPLADFVESDDSRLSDDRTPVSHGNDKHTSTYITADDIPPIPADISELTDTTGLLFSGDYDDLDNKPDLSSFLIAETDPAAMAVIGDEAYTEENYISEDNTLRENIDALDVAMGDVGTILENILGE